jgi:hypothetical protein
MRFAVLLAILALAGCASEATASRVDNRTFAIHGPGVPGGSEAPNRRLAIRLCPNGYRVLNQDVRRNVNDEGGVFTNWTIRCI